MCSGEAVGAWLGGIRARSLNFYYVDPVSITVQMRERSLDVAFLSPIDYALNSPD